MHQLNNQNNNQENMQNQPVFYLTLAELRARIQQLEDGTVLTVFFTDEDGRVWI